MSQNATNTNHMSKEIKPGTAGVESKDQPKLIKKIHKNLDNLNISLPFEASTLLLLAFTGIVLKLVLPNSPTADGSNGPATSAIWGYGMTAFSLLGLYLVILNLSFNPKLSKGQIEPNEQGSDGKVDLMTNVMSTIKQFFNNSFPIVSLVAVLTWIILINMSFLTRINKGQVADDFNNFSVYSTILICFQMIIVFKFILMKMNKGVRIKETGEDDNYLQKINKALDNQITAVSAVFTLLNLIFAGMMMVVLNFFSTDG